MSHFVAYILQFQEIIVYKIPPGGRGSIASLRSIMSSNNQASVLNVTELMGIRNLLVQYRFVSKATMILNPV